MRRIMRKTATLGAVLLFGLTACADLDVVNPNAPDAELALANPGDIVTLISGSYRQWWLSVHDPSGPSHVISNMSFQQSSWPANFGMVDYSRMPRQPIVNVGLHQFYGNVVNGVWFRAYRCLAAVAQGLKALEDPAIAGGLSADDLSRAQAFGRFMQGLCHGSLALFYEAGFVLDETVETRDAGGAPIQQTARSYNDLLQAALGYFDQAIALSQGQTWNIPVSWMSVEVPASELALLASTMKARYRANVARTPAERQAVNWDLVIEDLDAGLQSWNMSYGYFGPTFWNDILPRQGFSWIGWGQSSYMIYGMADQSGNYQEWLSVSPAETRHPVLPSGEEFLIVTPDQRFAQGSTRAEQQAGQDGNTIIQFNGGPLGLPANNWGQPARGTQRWSYYRNSVGDGHIFFGVTSIPEVTTHETRLLRAEAHYWNGDLLDAATLINATRVDRGGLSPAVPGLPDDGNTSCVPRLPNGSCGDLLEMLKWEKRMHTAFLGVHANTWYFDGRGWGDLYVGTPLHLPVPCDENDLWGIPCENVGGAGGTAAAPVSVYNWPDES
jgi:starch-binding outer membrane protein, SusD/RagB family